MDRLCSSDPPGGNCRKVSVSANGGMLLVLRNLRTQFSSFRSKIVGKVYIINNSGLFARNRMNTQQLHNLDLTSVILPMA